MMLALKSCPQIAPKVGNPAGLLCWLNHIQEPGTYRGHHQFKGPPTILRWKSNFEEIGFEIFTERGKTFTRFQCV